MILCARPCQTPASLALATAWCLLTIERELCVSLDQRSLLQASGSASSLTTHVRYHQLTLKLVNNILSLREAQNNEYSYCSGKARWTRQGCSLFHLRAQPRHICTPRENPKNTANKDIHACCYSKSIFAQPRLSFTVQASSSLRLHRLISTDPDVADTTAST